TLSFLPDNLIFFRSEPDAKDPTKCTFDLWCMAFPVAGQTHVESVMAGVQSMEEADTLERDFDGGRGVPEIIDSIVWQDLMLAEGQQSGWQSQGYTDANLAGQEARVRYFHEVLNDYLAGRRPQTNGGDNE
uniref:SRPBCC family protein n=1 Tax=Endozoicomonas sp. SESOKO4 TaxID=2828745 RepID=UPI0021473368